MIAFRASLDFVFLDSEPPPADEQWTTAGMECQGCERGWRQL